MRNIINTLHKFASIYENLNDCPIGAPILQYKLIVSVLIDSGGILTLNDVLIIPFIDIVFNPQFGTIV